jgi:hypothetical protein
MWEEGKRGHFQCTHKQTLARNHITPSKATSNSYSISLASSQLGPVPLLTQQGPAQASGSLSWLRVFFRIPDLSVCCTTKEQYHATLACPNLWKDPNKIWPPQKIAYLLWHNVKNEKRPLHPSS